MAEKLGLDGKLYYKVTGGSYVELTNVKDLTLNMEKALADVTTRAANGWKQYRGALKDASLEWEMVWDTADTGFIAIKDAYLNNTQLWLKALDSSGGHGFEMLCEITGFSKKEPLEEAQTVSVTAKPAYSATPPSYI